MAMLVQLLGVFALLWASSYAGGEKNAPYYLGEVAGGYIKGKLYFVGAARNGESYGDDITVSYDLASKTWISNGLAKRKHAGDHHGCVVYDDKLYLVGGLGAASGNKLQIYDPASNSWKTENMGFSTGSPNAVLLGSTLYVCGGIIGTKTVKTCYKKNLPNGPWSRSVAPMLVGVNHAAHVAYNGKMYVFGGRGNGNTVQNPFSVAQVYDPSSDSWTFLKQMPNGGQGGTGQAVASKGKIYIPGGETKTKPATGNSYTGSRTFKFVTVYDVASDSYTSQIPMVHPRHGIWCVLVNGVMHCPFGGVRAGNSQSNVYETIRTL